MRNKAQWERDIRGAIKRVEILEALELITDRLVKMTDTLERHVNRMDQNKDQANRAHIRLEVKVKELGSEVRELAREVGLD